MASERARIMRKNPTDAEKKLWSLLRLKQLDGHRFRRQAPIGLYIVDFFCPEARLIIEVDGGQHGTAKEYDEARTTWLSQQGHRVIRFWNNDILQNPDGVLLRLREALDKASTIHAETH
jgi:very-short-patch-repair endonuclease